MTDQFAQPPAFKSFDRHGRYLLPDPKSGSTIPWTRATTLARTLSDEYALNQWRIRGVVAGIGQRHDLAALAAATAERGKPFDELDQGQLQEIGDKALAAAESDRGANLGRAVHAFSQRGDGGTPDCPPQFLPYVHAYQKALEKAGFQIRPQYIERIVICPEVATAGQFDRLLSPVGGGRLVVGDLKSAKLESLAYAWLEIAIQLSVYAHSTMMWDQAQNRYHAMPDVDLGRAIVMHLPQDVPASQARCDIYEIDILKGWEAALEARRVRTLRAESKRWIRRVESVTYSPAAVVFDGLQASRERVGTPDLTTIPSPTTPPATPSATPSATPPEPTPLEQVQRAAGQEELSMLWKRGTEEGWWTPDLTAAGRARLAELASV